MFDELTGNARVKGALKRLLFKIADCRFGLT
jgi:hypothetical protein